MIRAILTHGVIQPIDPVPEDWVEGSELMIAEVYRPESPAAVDASDFESDPEDDERLMAALAAAHHQAKDVMRRKMGLP